MRKQMMLVAFVVAVAAMSFGQGTCKTDVALAANSTNGQTALTPAPRATIRVCRPGANGTPCIPLATIYTDATLAPVSVLSGLSVDDRARPVEIEDDLTSDHSGSSDRTSKKFSLGLFLEKSCQIVPPYAQTMQTAQFAKSQNQQVACSQSPFVSDSVQIRICGGGG